MKRRRNAIGRLPLLRQGPPGSLGRLADTLGLSRPAVCKWTRVPAEWVLRVERHTGISRHDLRPDLYPPPELAPDRTQDRAA